MTKDFSAEHFRRNREAIARWGEYVALERERGKSDQEIRAAILKSGVTPHTVEIVFAAVDKGKKFSTINPRSVGQLIIGAVIAVAGLAVLIIGLNFGYILYVGIAIFMVGLGTVGHYFMVDDVDNP